MRSAVSLLSAPVLSAALALSALLSPAQALAARFGAGDVPPSALGRDADGKPVNLSAYRGKVVVVAFWTSSCAYCLRELPTLDNLQKQLGGQGLQVVAVNVSDTSRNYAAMLRQMRRFSVVLARDEGPDVATAWDARMFPNLWILDPQGRVLAHHEDYPEEKLPAILAEIQRTVVAAQAQAQQAAPQG